MRVSIKCNDAFNKVIGKHVEKEGDVITDDKPDFILTDESLNTDVPVVRIGGRMPTSMLDLIDIEKGERFACVSKWFDRFEGWGEQLIISIPVYGMMENNRGANVLSGMALRYIDNSPLSKLFDNILLSDTLKQQRHTGFVSIGITENGVACDVEYGIPWGGNLVVLEGCQQRLAEFFTCPERLMESWSVGIYVTRYPFPFVKNGDRIHIEGLSKTTQKHIYTPFVEHYRNSSYTDNTMLALCTSWDKRLIDANKRALSLCDKIIVDEKQYRSDINSAIQKKWALLITNDIISPSHNGTVPVDLSSSGLPDGIE